jgi:WD40 repeat protein
MGAIRTAAFSPDGRRLVTAGEKEAKLWDLRTGELVLALDPEQLWQWIAAVAFSPDGRFLAVGGDGMAIALWDPRTGRKVRELPLYTRGEPVPGLRHIVTSLSFRPDGLRLASCSGAVAMVGGRPHATVDRSVRVWDVEKGQQEAVLLGPANPVWCVQYSPDGQRLAGGGVLTSGGDSRGELWVWDVRTERDHRLLALSDGEVNGLAFRPDGRRLATVGGNPKQFSSAGQLKLWDPATGELLRSLPLEQVAHCVDYSPDGTALAVGTRSQTIERRDAATGQVLQTLRGHGSPIVALHHSPDGNRLASAGSDGTLHLWELAGGQGRVILRRPGVLSAVRFCPKGNLLAAGTAGPPGNDAAEVLMYDLDEEGEPKRLGEPGRNVQTVAFRPDGQRLAALRLDGIIQVWDVASRRELLHFKAHLQAAGLCFSPDGRRLASTGFDSTVRLWDASTGQEVLTLGGAREPSGAVAFSPDGRWLAAGTGNFPGEVLLWDGAELGARRRLAVEGLSFTAVWFSETSTRLLARAAGGGVAAWSLPAGELVDASDVKVPPQIGPLAFSLNGEYEAAVQLDGTIHLVDLRPTPEIVAEWRGLAHSDRNWHDRMARRPPTRDSAYYMAFHARRALLDDNPDVSMLQLALERQPQVIEELRRHQDARTGAARRELRQLAEKYLALHMKDVAQRDWQNALLESTWVDLVPDSAISAAGATLAVESDRSVLASGTNPADDSYTLTCRVPLAGITGLRLEVLPDLSLKNGGPGRAPDNGNFELGEVKLTVTPAEGVADRPVTLVDAAASYSASAAEHYLKKDMRPDWAIDGDPRTYWNPYPALGVAQWLIVQTGEPVARPGDRLTVRLDFHTGQPRHALGHFRLAVTTDPRPAQRGRWRSALATRMLGPWSVLALAALFDEDWRAVASAVEKAKGETALDAALLALARGRLGEAGSGRAALDRARQLTARTPDALVAELVREAEKFYRD